MNLLPWMLGALGLLAVGLALWLIHRGCLWLERKGLLFYRDRKPESSAASCMVALQQFIEPGVRKVVEVREEQEPGDPQSGDSHRPRLRLNREANGAAESFAAKASGPFSDIGSPASIRTSERRKVDQTPTQ